MTTTTSSSVPRTFNLNTIATYAAMAPLIFWHPADREAFAAPVELRPPQHFVSLDGSPLYSTRRGDPSPTERIESIRTQLGLSMAALADILGVTRPTLYAWMRGTAMRPQNILRLRGLHEAANILTQAAGGTLTALWQYQNLPSGQSFADGMRAGGNPIELANALAEQWQRHASDAALLTAVFGD